MVEGRLNRIEDILKGYNLHETHCPSYKAMMSQTDTLVHITIPDCECWLKEETNDED